MTSEIMTQKGALDKDTHKKKMIYICGKENIDINVCK